MPATTLGPMARARSPAIVREQTAEALAQGRAGPYRSKRAFPDEPRRHALSRAAGPHRRRSRMRVMREESFGPVVGIMKVCFGRRGDPPDERFSPYGLTASIWTERRRCGQAHRRARSRPAPSIMNRCDYLDPALAWTGVKDTGRGASLSRSAMAIDPAEELPSAPVRERLTFSHARRLVSGRETQCP